MRLAQLAAHAESSYFDERERAVLALTDAVTRLSQAEVPDAVWDEAARVLDEGELTHALVQIALINAWNRIAAPARFVPASWATAEG